MEKHDKPYETRDLFTIWGILQLLRFYTRKLLDLDLLFSIGDSIRIRKGNYQRPNATSPLPLVHYCG
ncbi:Uncharacterized protein TCM_044490 [Theobroma cacao]|uniref:Glycosyl transferase CAP10 domain-containing protein n=1 Tax=Theobroma cacao TaxID=3641 RepID=A0A061FR56_THECC|nr:Uncharacterized protein TCM_044490 [Theobroma cacao]